MAGGEAGGCPAATYLSCFAKKGKPKKATPESAPRRYGCRGTLRYSRVKAAAELGLEPHRVCVPHLARPQTVLADCPFTRCVAQRLLWGPRSRFHRCGPEFSLVPKFTNFNLGPGLNPGRQCLLFSVVAWRYGVPMRVAEQRRNDRSSPRALSEGEQKLSRLDGTDSSPSCAAAGRSE